MAQQLINIGSVANDGTGDTWRDALDKVNDNFTENFADIAAIGLVFVAVESDFPVQDTTTITLEAGNVYVVTQSLTTAKRFVCEAASNITAFNQLGVILTYTGSGSMFTGVDVSFSVSEIVLNAPSGSLFTFSDVAVLNLHVFIMRDCAVVGAAKYGTFTSMASLVFLNVGTFDADDGITIAGTDWNVIRFANFGLTTTSATFIGIDLGVATVNTLSYRSMLMSGPAGAIAYKGAASSANIITGQLAKVSDSNFTGAITPLSGITVDDIRWDFQSNDQIQDTMPDALVSLNGNATETVISSSSTPVKVTGTFVEERCSQFTCDTTGRATYDGERDLVTPVDISATVDAASGTNKDVEVYLALNGSVIANSGKTIRVDSGSPLNISVVWQLSLSENDYLEIFVENDTDTVNLIVVDAILRVR
jgi:hypothetical protein